MSKGRRQTFYMRSSSQMASFPTSPSPTAAVPSKTRISASNDATVVNAAERIHVDRQTFKLAPRSANEVQIAAKDDHSNQVMTTNNYNYNNYSQHPSRPRWPNNHAAWFVQEYTGILTSDFMWHNRSFRPVEEYKNQIADKYGSSLRYRFGSYINNTTGG